MGRIQAIDPQDGSIRTLDGIVITWVKDWNPSVAYPLGYGVRYQGSSWMSLSDGNRGNVPAQGSLFWGLIAQGASGYTGFTGYTGPGGTGYTGYTGYTGPGNFTGTTGYSGYTGDTGYSGYIGRTGYTGYTGYSGYTGYTGYTGPAYQLVVLSGPTGWPARDGDRVIANAAGGAITVTLPLAAARAGAEVRVFKSDSSPNAVTVGNTSSDTTNLTTPWIISYGPASAGFVADGGTNWNIE